MPTVEPKRILSPAKTLVDASCPECCSDTFGSRGILRYNHNHTSMIPGRIGCELAVLTILCVLMIFFFPLMQGPYSVVNGPTTVFQAARAAARLRIVIVQGALNSLGSFLISPLVILSWVLLSQAEFRSVGLPEYNTILRC